MQAEHHKELAAQKGEAQHAQQEAATLKEELLQQEATAGASTKQVCSPYSTWIHQTTSFTGCVTLRFKAWSYSLSRLLASLLVFYQPVHVAAH